MSEDNRVLKALGKAHEESYFSRQNAALIEAMKVRLQHQRNAEDMGDASALDDDALLLGLSELGITRATLPLLHLFPLIQVAWADGEIQTGERSLILAAADERGIKDGATRDLLEGMLDSRPADALLKAGLDFIHALFQLLPSDEADAARSDLLAMSRSVADACGGVFGLWGRVEESETHALKTIGDRLNTAHVDAAKDVLGRV